MHLTTVEEGAQKMKKSLGYSYIRFTILFGRSSCDKLSLPLLCAFEQREICQRSKGKQNRQG